MTKYFAKHREVVGLFFYVQFRNNEIKFVYKGICVDKNNLFYGKKEATYGLDNFYAFKVKDGEFIDIRNEILKELGI